MTADEARRLCIHVPDGAPALVFSVVADEARLRHHVVRAALSKGGKVTIGGRTLTVTRGRR